MSCVNLFHNCWEGRPVHLVRETFYSEFYFLTCSQREPCITPLCMHGHVLEKHAGQIIQSTSHTFGKVHLISDYAVSMHVCIYNGSEYTTGGIGILLGDTPYNGKFTSVIYNIMHCA